MGGLAWAVRWENPSISMDLWLPWISTVDDFTGSRWILTLQLAMGLPGLVMNDCYSSPWFSAKIAQFDRNR